MSMGAALDDEPIAAALLTLFLALVGIALCLLITLVLVALYKTHPHRVKVPPLKIAHSDYDGDIIIVGAGCAGLFAAYTLEYCGVGNYTILEASAGFGGRCQELADFIDVPLDLGAEWIHADPRVLDDLLLFDDESTTTNVKTISYQPKTYATTTAANGKRRRRDWWRFFYREFKFYNTTWYGYLRDWVVPRVDASKLKFDAAVCRIDYSDRRKIRLETGSGEQYTADKVIVAVPLNILQQGDIVFTPPLPPPKRQAMAQAGYASGLKVWIEFDECFYADMEETTAGAPINFLCEDEEAGHPLFYNATFGKPSQRHCLAYFNVGPHAPALTARSDDEILAQLLDQLDRRFGGTDGGRRASRHYLRHRVQNWDAVAHVRGAYTFDWDEWPHYERTVAQLAAPIAEGRVYFAGEHCHAAEIATVHGAALSGRGAAQSLLVHDDEQRKTTKRRRAKA